MAPLIAGRSSYIDIELAIAMHKERPDPSFTSIAYCSKISDVLYGQKSADPSLMRISLNIVMWPDDSLGTNR
jgi:hypothetical protein